MTKTENDERSGTENYSEPTESERPSIRSDEERFGRDPLINGLTIVILRGRAMACMPPLDDAELDNAVNAWYETIIGVIPCQYWKEVGLYATRYTKPVDKFTGGQFFEAWRMFCDQGKARGYESWR